MCTLKEDKRNLCNWRYLITSVTRSIWIPSRRSGIFVTLAHFILVVIIQDKLTILIYSRGNWGFGEVKRLTSGQTARLRQSHESHAGGFFLPAFKVHTLSVFCNWWVHFSQIAHTWLCCGSHLKGWRHCIVPTYRETSGSSWLEHRLFPDWWGTYRVIRKW